MAYIIKSKGRPKVNHKVRGIDGIAPKDFIFHKIDRKNKQIIFKRIK